LSGQTNYDRFAKHSRFEMSC